MIPSDFIAEWRAHARWAADEQVEQDLVLSRALVEIFADPELAGEVALRGGTALHKLHFSPPRRYSEDLDLVQLRPGPIGSTMDRVRARLDEWLGEPRRERGEGFRLVYRFESEIPPVVRLRLKIETNTREHQAVRGTTKRPFSVASRWWRGDAGITTFEVEELLATKLRALYQRKKGRDLFDLWVALEAGIDPSAVVSTFLVYMSRGGHRVTRALFEENLAAKAGLPALSDDVQPLLSPGVTFDVATAVERVRRELMPLLPGEPWRGERRQGGHRETRTRDPGVGGRAFTGDGPARLKR
jgi:predicted nucleotidyltransferase component of viral defense system